MINIKLSQKLKIKLMKKFLNKIIQNKIGKKIRVLINYKPMPIEISKKIESQSISDAFIWRTDNNFETIFKFTDILKFFYNLESNLHIAFFNKKNVNIKNLKITNIQKNNEIIVNKDFLNGIEDYGTFYIFHKPTSYLKNEKKLILSNRCYVGFSKNKSNPSFVHGNTLVKSSDLNSNKVYSDIVQTSPFFYQNYYIQNDFSFFDKTEICICNPTSKKILFFVNKERYELEGLNITIIKLEKSQKLINIKSKCMFLRPIIFNFKKNFFDVYHA